jgi:hypothetical protein
VSHPQSPMDEFRTLCGCGNLRAKGRSLPSGAHPNIPAAERARLMPCTSIIALQRCSVQFGDLTSISAQCHSAVCIDVECLGCHSIIRFFCAQNFAYVGSLPSGIAQPSRPPVTVLPRSLQVLLIGPSIARPRKPSGHEPLIEDSDFDVMFSNKIHPKVGSVKHPIGMNEGLPSTDSPKGPRSYFT